MTPRLQKVPCQPPRVEQHAHQGRQPGGAQPPAAQRIPVRPNRRRNQPLTAAMRAPYRWIGSATAAGWVWRRKCQGCRTSPNRSILLPQQHAAASRGAAPPCPLAQPAADGGKDGAHHIVHGHERPTCRSPAAWGSAAGPP